MDKYINLSLHKEFYLYIKILIGIFQSKNGFNGTIKYACDL